MKANYLTSWDAKHYSQSKKETHTLTWFNEKRGYEKHDISQIKGLSIGNSIEIEKGHIVKRIS